MCMPYDVPPMSTCFSHSMYFFNETNWLLEIIPFMRLYYICALALPTKDVTIKLNCCIASEFATFESRCYFSKYYALPRFCTSFGTVQRSWLWRDFKAKLKHFQLGVDRRSWKAPNRWKLNETKIVNTWLDVSMGRSWNRDFEFVTLVTFWNH